MLPLLLPPRSLLSSFPLFLRWLRKKAINFAKAIIKPMIFIGFYACWACFVALETSCNMRNSSFRLCVCECVGVRRLSNGTKLKIYC